MAGGVAVIKVGAATEVEMKDKKLRIEDALNATKAAVEEGIVAGGGTATINAIPAVDKLVGELEGDERTGAKIVRKALEAPLRQIAANAGLEGSVVIDNILKANKPNYGFDAQKEEYVEDMIEAGIVDPTKGYPFCSGERRQRCRDGSDHREPRCRPARAAGSGCTGSGYGRYVLIRIPKSNYLTEALAAGLRPFVSCGAVWYNRIEKKQQGALYEKIWKVPRAGRHTGTYGNYILLLGPAGDGV